MKSLQSHDTKTASVMQVYFELFYMIILLNIITGAYKGFLNTTLDMKIKSHFHYDVFLHTKKLISV